MTKQESTGKCSLCKGRHSKATMTQHLRKCEQNRTVLKGPSAKLGLLKPKGFHIVVEGLRMPMYWMHLEVSADASLADLDDFLRDIWLECCRHMSAFTIDGMEYVQDTGGVDAMWQGFMGRHQGGQGMDVQVGSVLRRGLEFQYEYDFGTYTRLMLRVVSECEIESRGEPIRLLARNDPPSLCCAVCGRRATLVCKSCDWGKGWLCDRCASKHGCDEELRVPIANSPRVGICGYVGLKGVA